MLRIHTTTTTDNILEEDLTKIVSTAADLNQYHSELVRLCREHHGRGIAANQVGLRENFFFAAEIARFPSKNGKPVAHLCINPSWRPATTAVSTSVEGCLSLPGRLFDVPRSEVIAAEWTNARGHRIHQRLKGLAAIVFQHEYDHLRGMTLMQTGRELK